MSRRRGFLRLPGPLSGGGMSPARPRVESLGFNPGGEPDTPFKRDLLSITQLAEHARMLAHTHAVDETGGPDKLLARLDENEAVIAEAHRLIGEAAEDDRRIAPAGDWLIDNYYLIEEQVRLARVHLPENYSRELPVVAAGRGAGHPRVYELAIELISHIDGRVEPRALDAFMAAYQEHQPLKLGELWAVPIMLRLALIENLRRVCAGLGQARRERNLATDWAKRIIAVAEERPEEVVVELASLVKTRPELTGAFVSEFARRMQAAGPRVGFATEWAEQRLADKGRSIEQLVQAEGRRQAADQVSMGNSIGSLRTLQSVDWKAFVESHSVVERELRRDPAEVYPLQDFETRDRYRHFVEKTARRSGRPEQEVARLAVDLAASHADDPRLGHVGTYLVGPRREELERAAGAAFSFVGRLRRFAHDHAFAVFLGVLSATSVLVTWAALQWSLISGASWWVIALIALPLLLAASQWGVSLVNWLVSTFVTPQRLPRLDFEDGVPADCRAAVAVPCMLTSPGNVDALLSAMEVRHLANRDDQLTFVLLSDFADCVEEHRADDDALLDRAAAGVEALNERHGRDRFLLLHRPRVYNEREGCWMGEERKRGKLEDFNALLLDTDKTAPFSRVVGDLSVLRGTRYVICLDSDTTLPRDAARELVGTMAHPLNRPVVDPEHRVVTDGYGLLQPRASVSMSSGRGGRNLFVELFAGEPGVDPYTRAVSDVYQDAFKEGSFIGKGIYDVEAFTKTLGGRLPDNRILSHDLLEGSHVRSGLVSDVQVYEDYPTSFLVDMSRRHRWVRGDWQIASWVGPAVPSFEGGERNPVSALSRWKVFDNLRRSIVPLATWLVLVIGWCSGAAGAWTLFVLGLVFLPAVLDAAVRIVWGVGEDLPLGLHARAVGRGAVRRLGQAAVDFVTLPYQALLYADAVVRTLWRIYVSRRNLLQWTTADDAARRARRDVGGFYAAMWWGPAAAGAAVLLTLVFNPWGLLYALPVALLWAAGPAAAWFISRPAEAREAALSSSEQVFLRRLARRTWRFFEVFVADEDNHLPPDNFQEHPPVGIAHRTSPTNIGLSLLANVAAHDFGYATAATVLDRCGKTLATMDRLDRHDGHLYNWYDTRSLEPLPPAYVSTVDSGNLSGSLLVLRSGLLELVDAPLAGPQVVEGLRDTLGLILDAATGEATLAGDPKQDGPAKTTAVQPPREWVERTRGLLRDLGRPASLAELHRTLGRVGEAAAEAETLLVQNEGQRELDAGMWATCLRAQVAEVTGELARLAPWLGASEVPAACRALGDWPTPRQVAGLGEVDGPLVKKLAGASAAAGELCDRARGLAADAERLAGADYRAAELYDPARKLLRIGYNAQDRRADAGYYDLLASEARLASYYAIATGQLPQDHWFSLGRSLTTAGSGHAALLSWSGSMFEYLMPLLVMPTYEGTLLHETYRGVVDRQIEYGRQRGVPWGISESGYHVMDAHKNYQYRPFGVPGLGFKRGLSRDLVIAPYATVMAVMVDAKAAVENLMRLRGDGFLGRYGFFEAVDYTPARLPRGKDRAVVRSYMAHHSGMSFLSLAKKLLGEPMQRRFLADPRLRSVELLLQEKVSMTKPVHPHAAEADEVGRDGGRPAATLRVFTTPDTPTPEVHLLSNGRYTVMVTAAGGGYSRWNGQALTRWREDATRDAYGTFIYLRDVTDGDVWSAAHQPVLKPAKSYEAVFSQARAEFRRRDGDIETHTTITVSPEDDVELRRVELRNNGQQRRTIELTSFAEVVLNDPAAERSHPAFSNLFIQTELLHDKAAVLVKRRPRKADEHPPVMLHLVAARGPTAGRASFDTSRNDFVGRTRTPKDPQALESAQLGDTHGDVLDPCVAVRRRVVLGPGERVTLDVITGCAETRERALELVEMYRDPSIADRIPELAWSHSDVALRQLNITEADAQLFARLAGSVVYASPTRRADAEVIAANRKGQPGLWGFGISGDLPIVLLSVSDRDKLGVVRQLVQAHAYWRRKGLETDLVVLIEDEGGYRDELQEAIMGVIGSGPEAGLVDKPGGVFVRRAEQMSADDRRLLETVARVVLADSAGTLEEQIDRRPRGETRVAKLAVQRPVREPVRTAAEVKRRRLLFDNATGGFTFDGREYVITTGAGQVTPAPWINVLANEFFGCIVSESGGGYTWCENAHEYRLTPWRNDPVTDASGEHLYLRDEETGRYWSPTPLPAKGDMPYTTRHGFGYTVFEYEQDGIASELWVYVAPDAPVKFYRLKLRNASGRRRRLSAFCYAEWVLGELRAKAGPHVVTEVDPESGAVLARNSYTGDFADRVSFLDCSEERRTVTGDRAEFLGRNGTYAEPEALRRARLSGTVGAGLDPCAAIRTPLELEDDEERTITFTLGSGMHADDARMLIHRFRGNAAATDARQAVWDYWNPILGEVHVETPDKTVDVLVNGWLPYQVLACRYFGRSGYYQSGGAFGFRDQLQDVAALLHHKPDVIREHLLRAARHQFTEGDVLHWWHPPTGAGVRTHFSDDYLWLPLVAARYVTGTGDTGVLDEVVPSLDGPPVPPEQEAIYQQFPSSGDPATLYEHCKRSIRNATTHRGYGAHGVPLIGCGDWNDGMNLIGEEGRGESVWMAFFLIVVMKDFAEVARARGDDAFVAECEAETKKLRDALETNCWDGSWYLRAFFDDGTPLGSEQNVECQIDALPQSWSVLSGMHDEDRSRQAMQAVDHRLVRRDCRLIQLFDPPFDECAVDPGYIKGYLPGVRENGGQYTHAAVWTVMAFAEMGDTERAWDLFHLINPVRHAWTQADMQRYKVEPYVVAADVYGEHPHTGRGGWTWYTGSAGWMYRLVFEHLLGVRLEHDHLCVTPKLPDDWGGFKLHYRHHGTLHHLDIRRGEGQSTIDGDPCDPTHVPLRTDGIDHEVVLYVQ